MESKDWQQIEEVFHSALPLGATERSAYLSAACSGNEALRGEVESLLAAFEDEPSFIEQPALTLGMKVLSGDKPGMLAGRSVGSYKILRLLGRGGMGEVYIAEDSKLGRRVALKFLADKFVDDGWAKKQLTKEARAVAMLEHPNICAVYGVEEIDGYNFIVMQYIEGETLASLMKDEPLPHRQALEFAEQIASALSSAHAHGIIHRDVKPQNIVVTQSGQVKVLDFGLAKFVQRQEALENAGDSLFSRKGLIVGTIAYMSPEQLRAEELDYRSDIFSFGTVLHEMLGGENPFKRENDADTINAILSSQPPPLADVAPQIPEAIDDTARKCLEKDRTERYQTADELLHDLRSIREDWERGVSRPRKQSVLPKRRYVYAYALAARAFLILLMSIAAYVYNGSAKDQPKVQTLAVLPLVNQSADPGMDYLSKGLVESLTDKLSHVSSLRVKTVTAVSFDKQQTVAPDQTGRALNVDAVLVGQVIKQQGALLLQMSVVRSTDGAQIWQETFNLNAGEILRLQTEIIRKISLGLRLLISPEEEKLLDKRATENQEALRLYWLGRYHWNQRSREDIQKAINYFDEAIRLDPLYAKAHAGLADSYLLLNLASYGTLPTKEAMLRARAAAKDALKYDATISEAHTSLGSVKLKYEWDWPEAEKAFKQAIEINPEYVPARYGYANLLVVMRRFDEAIRESETAREIDPFSPMGKINLGRAYYYARQYEKAAGYFNEVLAANAQDPRGIYMLGLVYLQTGRYDESIKILERLHSIDPLFAAAPLGYAYGKTGQRTRAHSIIKELDEAAQHKPVPPLEKAIVYIGLNDKDAAFNFLQQAFDERFSSLINLTTEPLFDDLRPDPRFAELARRINLTP
ncbi:MAG: protein kinase [Pyrinomonadaceae bacterium]|nr:protein kinase [Pyrinomonadaceae bacterium]